eukprot:1279191-Amphidinium_carterae.1
MSFELSGVILNKLLPPCTPSPNGPRTVLEHQIGAPQRQYNRPFLVVLNGRPSDDVHCTPSLHLFLCNPGAQLCGKPIPRTWKGQAGWDEPEVLCGAGVQVSGGRPQPQVVRGPNLIKGSDKAIALLKEHRVALSGSMGLCVRKKLYCHDPISLPKVQPR